MTSEKNVSGVVFFIRIGNFQKTEVRFSMKGRDLGQTPKSVTNFELISLGFKIACCIIENPTSFVDFWRKNSNTFLRIF